MYSNIQYYVTHLTPFWITCRLFAILFIMINTRCLDSPFPLWWGSMVLVSLCVVFWHHIDRIEQLMEFFSSLDVELSAHSAWLPNVDSLDFINDPIKSGPYQCPTLDMLKQPNIGLYTRKSTAKNHIFLEHESRLCHILSSLDSREATNAKEGMEDWVIQELIRINRLKEIEWSGQRSKGGIKGAVVNTGMLSSLMWWLQLTTP